MLIAILTGGSLGDVQPYVALGAGLRSAGFRVRLATHVGFRELVEAHGLEFAAVAHPPTELTQHAQWEALQHAGDTALRFTRTVGRISAALQPVLDRMLDDHWRACQGASAVLSSVAAFAGRVQAEALQIPHCWALVQPMSPTAAYPHFLTPPGVHLPGLLNLRTYAVAERVHHRLFGHAVDRWRADRLGGSPQKRPVPGSLFGTRAGAVLYGVSPTMVATPADWPANITQVGHWFLDAPAGTALPSAVDDFLGTGPPPVFVHAARIGGRNGAFADVAACALRRLGLRGLVSGPLSEEHISETVQPAPPAPFDRLFPHLAAVVHHGGAGTTATALRAGTPSLGIPGFFDQPFWSARVAALGAGPPPVHARRVTEARLETALARLVNEKSFRPGAAAAAGRMRAEHGVADAVARLQSIVEPSHA